jgi:ketosteroid isomerase-like protein
MSCKPDKSYFPARQVFGVVLCLIIASVAIASEKITATASGAEQTLWNLEHAYWRYVQDNDLSAYSNLWHEQFLGWPSVSSAPVRKNHITDWITTQTSKGLTFKTGELKRASIQVTGNVAMVCYWITFKWLDKDGHGVSQAIRITHAWLKTGNDWHIIGGMSMPEAETTAK